MSGRGSTGAGVRTGAAGGSATRRCWLSRAARARDWRSASAQSDAAVASWTIASGKRFWAASDSAPLNTVSPPARSAGVAPASIARLIALAARARSDRSKVSSFRGGPPAPPRGSGAGGGGGAGGGRGGGGGLGGPGGAGGVLGRGHQRGAGARLRQRNHLAAHGIVGARGRRAAHRHNVVHGGPTA